MRNISQLALDTLATQKGIEPLNVVEVIWVNTSYFYADKTIEGIPGKILSLANLENVVNIGKAGLSHSVSITLDDTDGTIKNIYNYNDIHKKQVNIYQWFSGIPFNDKFLIFQGVINSPIVWKEGDRSISFEIVSRLEDAEVGFSVEDGFFDSVPNDLIGKAWPLPFGQCFKVPGLQIDIIPSGVVLDAGGVEDFTIKQQIEKLAEQALQIETAAVAAFYEAGVAYTRSHFGPPDNEDAGLDPQLPPDQSPGGPPEPVIGAGEPPTDPLGGPLKGPLINPDQEPRNPFLTFHHDRVDEHWISIGDQLTDQGNALMKQYAQITQDLSNLLQTYNLQKKYNSPGLRIQNGECFPQNTPIRSKIRGVMHEGYMSGSIFQLLDRIHPGQPPETNTSQFPSQMITNSVDQGPQPIIQKANFVWIPPGDIMTLETDLPIRYVVAMIPVTVTGVFAFRLFDGQRMMTAVPGSYYSIGLEAIGPVVATVVTLARPLTYYREGWEGDIFADVISPIGPNTVDIITWIIQNFSVGPFSGGVVQLGIDAQSFNDTRNRIAPFPSNFCLLQRQNIISLLTDIAYQSRCAIWLENDIFHLRYLVDSPGPVDTISESDIIYNTLEIHNTSTEELITKYIANYRVDYSGEPPKDTIIIRNNISKYGVHETSTEWFIYNNYILVELGVTFWSIRKSNTWKLLQFKTPLTKLRLETFDGIVINIPSASNGPVVGVIEGVKLDTENLEIEFYVWIPVRTGEMTQYDFAYPLDDEENIYPTKKIFPGTGGISGTIITPNLNCGQIQIQRGQRPKITTGSKNPGTQSPNTTEPPNPNAGVVPELDSTPQPSFSYNYNNYRVNTATGVNSDVTIPPITVPGRIISGDGPNYKIEMYSAGIQNKPLRTFARNISHKSKLDPGTWVMVSVVVWRSGRGGRATIQSKKYFLPPGGESNIFPGKVTGNVGGVTYNMDLYKKDLLREATPVTGVIQLQIDPSDVIPNDTWALVLELPTVDDDGNPSINRYMQVPVFLE